MVPRSGSAAARGAFSERKVGLRYRSVSEHRGRSLGTERYRLLQEIGRGGMGAVHRARDQSLEREAALKLLHENLRADEEQLERFIEEAQITGQLDHPNIVPVYELGEDPGGALFFSMKLVEGEDLESLIELAGRHRLEPPRLSELLGIFLKVCEAVAFAHSRGVVHCDLKPANVMVGEFGQVYVMDWGVARRRDLGAPGRAGVPSNGTDLQEPLSDDALGEDAPIVGSPAYMSPEQARGRWDLVDERSDIFLLGGTLYHILTGQAPYQGALLLQMIRAQEGDVEPPEEVTDDPRLPATLAAIARRAMAADPRQRYALVDELRVDVERFLHGSWHQPEQVFPAGSRIVVEGEDGDTAYVIVDGHCAVTTETASGTRILRHLGPGEVFGETAIFASAPRTATVEALDEVTVRVVTRDTLTAGLGLNSWLGVFIKALADRFADVDRRLREHQEG